MLGISCGIPVAAHVGSALARELGVDVVVNCVHHVVGSSEDGSLSTGVRVLEDMVREDEVGGGVDIGGASQERQGDHVIIVSWKEIISGGPGHLGVERVVEVPSWDGEAVDPAGEVPPEGGGGDAGSEDVMVGAALDDSGELPAQGVL